MSEKNIVLWLSQASVPGNLVGAVASEWQLALSNGNTSRADQLRAADVVVVDLRTPDNDEHALATLLAELKNTASAALFLTSKETELLGGKVLSQKGPFVCVDESSSDRELAACLMSLHTLAESITDLQQDIATLRQENSRATGALETLDEEMRLAARLQRDFLPRRLPELGPVKFGVLFKPASFVSGDIYDVTRLDETHLGFYIADAVGHGMPAALLTMFIKKSLQTKRILGNTYEIVSPEVSLGQLNEDICGQDLSSCQFCTAVYATLDTSNLSLRYCRAGHPEPILVRADGSVELMGGKGTLLGVFEEQTFESREIRLAQGDRVVLFTDGAEDALQTSDNRKSMLELISPDLRKPRDEFLIDLTARLEQQQGSDEAVDDVTVIVMDVEA